MKQDGYGLVAAMCVAEVLTMAGVFAFPALLPVFFAEWSLTNTEAGWVSGIYFAAYAVTVPVLVTLTDHVDARWVYVGGAVTAALASAGFALFADGFGTALVFRALAGAGLAATYMPGLRVLVDRYSGNQPSRAVALYTSSFSLGTALSFLLAGDVEALFGWRSVFIACAIAAVMAAAIAIVMRPVKPARTGGSTRFLDFRPVLRNRPAMGYILAYGVHCWELFTLRSWLVAFLALSLTLRPHSGAIGLAPTTVAMLSGLIAMMASVGGNELCLRFGRVRVIQAVMVASIVFALGIGFSVSLSYAAVVVLALIYSAIVQLDSAALTAGAVEASEEGRRGATMAVHAFFGFGCAFIGPLVFGVVLDATETMGPRASWGLAFASVGAIGILGPAVLRLSRTRSAHDE